MSWRQYVERHVAGRRQAELARLVEVDAGTVSRWRKGGQGVDAGVAIRFARAVGDDPLAALIAAGYLTAAEAKARPALVPDYGQLSNGELLELVRARMERGEVVGNAEHPAPASTAGATPVERPMSAPDGSVVDVVEGYVLAAHEHPEVQSEFEAMEQDSP